MEYTSPASTCMRRGHAEQTEVCQSVAPSFCLNDVLLLQKLTVAVHHAQDTGLAREQVVNQRVGRILDEPFPGTLHPARFARARKRDKVLGRFEDTLHVRSTVSKGKPSPSR